MLLERHGGDGLQLRILRLDGLVELREAAFVAAGSVEPVLVADLDVVQREGLGVAELGADGSPLGAGVAGDELDLFESVVDVGRERGAGVDVVALERVSGEDREHGLDLEVFGPFEKFEEAHAVGGLVVPRAAVRGAVDEWAEGVLPVEALVDLVALKIVAAGQAQELRVHSRHQLHDVGAVAVLAVLVGRRKERDERDPELAGVTCGDEEMIGARMV